MALAPQPYPLSPALREGLPPGRPPPGAGPLEPLPPGALRPGAGGVLLLRHSASADDGRLEERLAALEARTAVAEQRASAAEQRAAALERTAHEVRGWT